MVTPTSNQTINYQNIQDCFKDSTSIELIIDNEKSTFSKTHENYKQILSAFETLINSSHQAPAFGVSLDDLTRQELQNGVWIEFNFNKTCYNSDMPFDSLLINVQSEFNGFNIIRKYQNKYDGRCFYLNLIDSDMSSLYNLLVSL